MQKFQQSLGFRLLCISFALFTMPILIEALTLAYQNRSLFITEVTEELEEIAYQRELTLSGILPIHRSSLKTIELFLSQEQQTLHNPKPLNLLLKAIAQAGDFKELSIITHTPLNQYTVVASNKTGQIGKNYTNLITPSPIDTTTAGTQPRFSYLRALGENQSELILASPLVWENLPKPSKPLLLIFRDISQDIQLLLAEKTFPQYKTKFALLLPSGFVFDATDSEMQWQYFPSLIQSQKVNTQNHETLNVNLLYPDLPVLQNSYLTFLYNDVEYTGYQQPIPSLNSSLLSYSPTKDLLNSPKISLFHLYNKYVLILIICGTFAYILSMRMSQPLCMIIDTMESVHKGSLNSRYQPNLLGFEINQLGLKFNNMLDSILIQQEKQEKERLLKACYEQELQIGHEIQRNLLPKALPHYPGTLLASAYIPAIEVSGDFYDAYIRSNKNHRDELVLSVADAAGKGAQACFFSLSTKNMLREFLTHYSNVSQGMAATNDLLYQDAENTSMFISVISGIYQRDNRTLYYYSAGHNPPIVCKQNGTIFMLKEHGLVMGVFPAKEQEQQSIRLDKGDTVIFYSDGITEAHDNSAQLYGEKRLIRLIQSNPFINPTELCNNIIRDVRIFSGLTPQHDDMTLLVMQTT